MTLTLAGKDADLVLAEALAIYKTETGVTLAPADPRRLHLQALVALLAQCRALIDFSGKQSLLRYVTSVYIEELAALWGEVPIPAAPSVVMLRFTSDVAGILTIPAGKRATDGTSLWSVITTTTSAPASLFVDAQAQCTVNGSASNGVAPGQIDTMVDAIAGIASVANTTTTISGRDIEGTEALRTRLRNVPESRSTCGPRLAYQDGALEASSSVADAVALGPDDAGEMAGTPPNPGEVFVLLLEGERDDAGVLVSIIPDPSVGLINEIDAALSAEDVRPLGDLVITKAPEFVEFDANVTYYISRSRQDSAAEIQVAVEAAWDAWLLWQQSKIGRDINPSRMTTDMVNAGAKRVAVTDPVFAALARDESAKVDYIALVYGGVEDD